MIHSVRSTAAIFVLALLAAPSAAGSTPSDLQDGEEDLSLVVQGFLLKQCGGCHGSHLDEPEGDFGFSDDLRRLAGDEDFVVPGDPEDSILFVSVLDPEDPDFMPPTDAEEAPLTPPQVEQFRRWIQGGARVSDAAQALMGTYEPEAGGESTGPDAGTQGTGDPAEPDGGGEPQGTTPADERTAETAAPEKTLEQRWRRFIGQFHTASSHLPVGLLLAALLAEFLSMLMHGPRMRYVARFCLFFGFLGATYSSASGWFLAENSSKYEFTAYDEPPAALFEDMADRKDLNNTHWHRWLGVATAGFAFLTWILSWIVSVVCHRPEGTRAKKLLLLYRLGLLLLATMTSVVGFLGGVIVHGSGKYLPL